MGEFYLQGNDGYLHLGLPDTSGQFGWEHFLGQLLIRLESLTYQDCGVIFTSGTHAIDRDQFAAVMTILAKHRLRLHKLVTTNRATAILAATLGLSVEQPATLVPPHALVVAPLYLQKIIRSGVIVHHPGSVILRGDVHAGGEIVSDGDILVWGKLKGKAHTTNPQSTIMALELTPTQLQIGPRLALVESNPSPVPEVAYLDGAEICIVTVAEFKYRN